MGRSSITRLTCDSCGKTAEGDGFGTLGGWYDVDAYRMEPLRASFCSIICLANWASSESGQPPRVVNIEQHIHNPLPEVASPASIVAAIRDAT